MKVLATATTCQRCGGLCTAAPTCVVFCGRLHAVTHSRPRKSVDFDNESKLSASPVASLQQCFRACAVWRPSLAFFGILRLLRLYATSNTPRAGISIRGGVGRGWTTQATKQHCTDAFPDADERQRCICAGCLGTQLNDRIVWGHLGRRNIRRW